MAYGAVKEVRNVDTGEVFRSAKEAAEKYFVHKTSIRNCCAGRYKKSAGYRWEYTGNIINNKTNARPVKNINTGEVFGSIRYAARQYGIHPSSIWSCCSRRAGTAGGYRWRYARSGEQCNLGER